SYALDPALCSTLDGNSYEIPPLSPRAIVVLHIGITEQILQHEPGVTRPLANPAVRDDRFSAHDTVRGKQRGQLIAALERAIVIAGLRPGDVSRARDVPSALAGLSQPRRREDLTAEFLWAPDVDEDGAPRAHRLQRLGQKRAHG